MKRHFEQELELLKTSLIKMGSVAESAVAHSIDALLRQDNALAQNVIDGDERVNQLEVEIDTAIVDLLVLQQPVAIDLRFILAAQKINNDLERIGDHAVNIAESAITLMNSVTREQLLELPDMAVTTQSMLRDAIDGFIRSDVVLGRRVLELDDRIDDMNRKIRAEVASGMKDGSQSIVGGLELVRVSRNLERIADLATNIAEEVIFVVQARVVKHHAEEKP